jgi:phenylalanyl-tRNA synthetase beta chain
VKVSIKWLKTLVDVPSDLATFSSTLDLTGTAVDEVYTTGDTLDGIVVGHILTRDAHPNADTLWVTTVDVGDNNLGEDGKPEPLQIVCGAQNFVAGDKVPVALIGTVMPDGNKIKKAKLRGIASCGMNCSARELGIGSDHSGLLILDKDAPVGMPIASYLASSDTVFDLEITPHRPDCMGVLGVAREVGAVYDTPYRLPSVDELLALDDDDGGASTGASRAELQHDPTQASSLAQVTIDDPVLCPRYTAHVVRGVKVAPSPKWLAERVQAAGTRSINNIVDITNYIMYELGQPLHAFDMSTLKRDADGRVHIVIRSAKDGEKFTTLDGAERVLSSDITCIVDGNAAGGAGETIGLAGVMGGLNSEIKDNTTDILIESATFSQAHTSRTSRGQQLFSEAAARYERGVDAEGCADAGLRAAELMARLGGGKLCEGIVDEYPAPKELPALTLRVGRLQRFIGADVPAADIKRILESLGCEVSDAPCADTADADAADSAAAAARATTGAPLRHSDTPLRHSDTPLRHSDTPLRHSDTPLRHSGLDPESTRGAADTTTALTVIPPSYRPDLEREIDLYEEVLRLWGMSRVESTLPGGRKRIGSQTIEQQRNSMIASALRSSGLNETMTYAFAAHDDMERLRMPVPEGTDSVELINPINADQNIMRQTIIPGLLRSVAYNQSHDVSNIQLYEIGTVFTTHEGLKHPKERSLVAGVMAGAWHDAAWDEPARTLDFFDGKGVIENLLREINAIKVRFSALDAGEAPWLQPGRAAKVMADSKYIGWIGEIHPEVCAAFDVEAPVVAFELETRALQSAAADARELKEIPTYPAVEYDLALVMPEDVTAERAEQSIRSAGGKLLYDMRLFDVYRDAEKLGANKKSLAYKLYYRASDRTLTSEEAEKVHSKVIRKVTQALGAEVRA